LGTVTDHRDVPDGMVYAVTESCDTFDTYATVADGSTNRSELKADVAIGIVNLGDPYFDSAVPMLAL